MPFPKIGLKYNVDVYKKKQKMVLKNYKATIFHITMQAS